jgi:hypothetical protein
MRPTEIMKPAAKASIPSSARTLQRAREMTASAPTRLALAAATAYTILSEVTREREGLGCGVRLLDSHALEREPLRGRRESGHEIGRGRK